MRFPQILSELMKRDGLSAYKLEKLTGISNSLIGYYVKGERTPSEKNLLKLSECFKVSVDYLLGNEQKENPSQPKQERYDERMQLIARKMEDIPEDKKQALYRLIDSTIDNVIEVLKDEKRKQH